ncbi:hypothetical protein NE619_00590 [Anaerovorax odorimutans]|uniref:Uncharacterized protein n=1 Tax=Anaerovorax odorimutans TaxID=109327 RepID=A0ABT1RJ72_9FIRM|nr:hypothetical protein [Anaerovorax odorimutans]MCQ4635229.1 hypothetical protein [Anaerovorax odorimutans]
MDINDMDEMMMRCGKSSRQKELARRYLKSWNTDMTDEEAERLLGHEEFVKSIVKEYMRKELETILLRIKDLEGESGRKVRREKKESLLNDLRLLLPDLIDILE